MTGRRGGRDLFSEAAKGLDAALESFSRAREGPGGAERGGSPAMRVVEGGGAGGARPLGSAASQVVAGADKGRRRRRRSGGARAAVRRPSIEPEWLTDAVAGRLAVPGPAEARTDEEIVAACAAAARGLAAAAVREGV